MTDNARNIKSETIEFARPKSGYIAPRTAGEPFPDFPARDLSPFDTKIVPAWVAELCRLLSRRGRHGAYIDAIGGPDALAELDLYGIGYEVYEPARRGGWGPVWVRTEVVFRFAEDHALASLAEVA